MGVICLVHNASEGLDFDHCLPFSAHTVLGCPLSMTSRQAGWVMFICQICNSRRHCGVAVQLSEKLFCIRFPVKNISNIAHRFIYIRKKSKFIIYRGEVNIFYAHRCVLLKLITTDNVHVYTNFFFKFLHFFLMNQFLL